MPQPMRAVRDLARKRMQSVQQRTIQIASIGTCLAQQTGSRLCSNDVKQPTDAHVDAMSLGIVESIGIKANQAVLQTLQIQIDGIEKALSRHCRGNPGYRRLKTVSGIGPILATVILLETVSIERFADVRNYASYGRCVGSIPVPNGKKKGEGNTKNGNGNLAWAYVGAANFAIRYCEPARKFYQRKKAKRNGIVALKAVAHKLTCLVRSRGAVHRLASAARRQTAHASPQ